MSAMAVALRPAPLAPPLKWAGGKRWLVPHLLPLWNGNEERRLVEPFVGGLAVTLGLQPHSALLNDLNPHLIAFYKQLQSGLDLKRTKIATFNDRTVYMNNRARFNELVAQGKEQSAEAAALFYYLNRTGYNGLCRFNHSGEFNVPFGRHKTIPYTRDFTPYRAIFANWELTAGPFEYVTYAPDDFVYADPPYDVEFTQYSKEGFGWEDQVRLAEWLAAHPGPVALSNQATERIVTLYESLGFTLRFYDAPRMISRTGDRTPAREVLALRNM